MASMILVRTVYGHGLLSDGTKPLPEPMLTYHERDPVAFIPGNVYWKNLDINRMVVFKFSHLKPPLPPEYFELKRHSLCQPLVLATGRVFASTFIIEQQ